MRRAGHALPGIRLALTLLTVAPLRSDPSGRSSTGGPDARADALPIDRATAAVAMSVAPAVGALLGLVLAGLGLAVREFGAAPLLAAVLTIGTGVLLTRALHLDGLADTVDALGSYADRARALAIMRQPDVGPFGVVAIVLSLLSQVAAASVVLTRPWLSAAIGVMTATAAGRLAIAACCRRGVPSARPGGLGALVASTVPTPALLLSTAALLALAAAAVPGRAWQGPAAVLAGLGAVLVGQRHVTRRLGGVTGDVLGAGCELGTVITYVMLAM
ncbi:MAG TPA: adenosylcobinamide-GDP ribazoletransferase [Micromonosporaceae bacterium]